LRKEGAQTPVLVLTVKGAVEDRVAGLRAGADDYLTKPFALEELVARIDSLVRRRYQERNPAVRIGDFELNTAARTASRNGRVLTLTPREYRLLELLVLRRGEVVPRSVIEEHLYGEDVEVFSNVVDSTISALRKKVDPEGCPPHIHTRRGMGYLFE
jgi:DNA-binding response OmpR family regulator